MLLLNTVFFIQNLIKLDFSLLCSYSQIFICYLLSLAKIWFKRAFLSWLFKFKFLGFSVTILTFFFSCFCNVIQINENSICTCSSSSLCQILASMLLLICKSTHIWFSTSSIFLSWWPFVHRIVFNRFDCSPVCTCKRRLVIAVNSWWKCAHFSLLNFKFFSFFT